MRDFVLSLQLSPAAPLFGSGDRPDIPERTYQPALRHPLHGKLRDTVVVDLSPIRYCIREWAPSTIAVSTFVWKYVARSSDGNADDDRKRT